jgi:hypothetical protein
MEIVVAEHLVRGKTPKHMYESRLFTLTYLSAFRHGDREKDKKKTRPCRDRHSGPPPPLRTSSNLTTIAPTRLSGTMSARGFYLDPLRTHHSPVLLPCLRSCCNMGQCDWQRWWGWYSLAAKLGQTIINIILPLFIITITTDTPCVPTRFTLYGV